MKFLQWTASFFVHKHTLNIISLNCLQPLGQLIPENLIVIRVARSHGRHFWTNNYNHSLYCTQMFGLINIQHAILSLLMSNFISVCFVLNIFVTVLRRHCCDRGYIVSHASLRTWTEDVTHSMSITPDCAKSHICWWAGEKAAVIIPWLCDLPTGGEMLQRDSSSADGSKNLLSPWIPCNYKSIKLKCFYLTHFEFVRKSSGSE